MESKIDKDPKSKNGVMVVMDRYNINLMYKLATFIPDGGYDAYTSYVEALPTMVKQVETLRLDTNDAMLGNTNPFMDDDSAYFMYATYKIDTDKKADIANYIREFVNWRMADAEKGAMCIVVHSNWGSTCNVAVNRNELKDLFDWTTTVKDMLTVIATKDGSIWDE